MGAYDGEFVSNTSCLADAGWKGIYIEPIETYYKQCALRHQHNNVVCLNCAAGAEEKEITIFQGGAITTTDPKQVNRYANIDWAQGIAFVETKCQQRILNTILEEQKVYPHFDLLCVDVEGTEQEVFKGFDLEYWKPKMMLVELEDVHESFQKFQDHVQEHSTLRKFIIDSGYKEIYKNEINTIFLRNDITYKG